MNRRLHPSVEHVLAETVMPGLIGGVVNEGMRDYEQWNDPEEPGMPGGGPDLASVMLGELEDAIDKAHDLDSGLDELANQTTDPKTARQLRRMSVYAEDLIKSLRAMEKSHHDWKDFRKEKRQTRGRQAQTQRQELRSLKAEREQQGKAETRLTRNRDIRRDRRREAESKAGASQIPRP